MKVISQIFTRLNEPYFDDCRNLKRLLQFINHNSTDGIFIGADLLHEMVTWIKDVHAIHPNMLGRTGGFISFVKVFVHAISRKHKSNTRSTYEYELVGISE